MRLRKETGARTSAEQPGAGEFFVFDGGRRWEEGGVGRKEKAREKRVKEGGLDGLEPRRAK